MSSPNDNDKIDILIEFARRTKRTLSSSQVKMLEHMKICLDANDWDISKATFQYDNYYRFQLHCSLEAIVSDIENDTVKFSNYSYE